MEYGNINKAWAAGVISVAKTSSPKSKKPETKTKDPQADILKTVIDDFKSAWDYTSSSWHDRWEDNYKAYNNVRTKIGYEGITDTFVPMVYPTVETMTAALFGMKPKFMYVPPSSKPDQKTDILNGLLDYYWDKDQWSLKVINTGRAMFNLGTGVDYFMWNIDHPKMINIPLRDFFIDPTSTSIESARYLGRRYLSTIEELESYEIVDPTDTSDSPQMIKRFKNLDQVKAGSDAPEKTDKEEKDLLYGSTLNKPEDKQVEVIEYWTSEKTVTIINREVVAEDVENWYLARAKAMGIENPERLTVLKPFADARDIVDPSLFYAKGETDFILDQQELLNDVTNQNIDSITFTLNQMYTIPPENADKITEVENLPGAVYPFEVKPIQQRPIDANAFNERTNIKNEIRETSASNEVVRGVGQQGASTTATEINAQIAGAGQRVNLKVTQVENGYFYRMSKIVFDLVRLFVTEPTMVRILGKDGANWEEFDPSEYRDGEYEPRVQLDVTVQNNKQMQANNAKELLGAFLNDPDINQQELKKLVLQRSFDLDPDEVGLLTTPLEAMGGELPPEVMSALPPEMMGAIPAEAGAMPTEMPPEVPPMAEQAQTPIPGLENLPPEVIAAIVEAYQAQPPQEIASGL